MSDENVAKDIVPKVEANGKIEEETNIKTTSAEVIKDNESNDKKKEISTREAYFSSLELWVKNANAAQNAMALFPLYMYNNFPQIFQPQLNYGLPMTQRTLRNETSALSQELFGLRNNGRATGDVVAAARPNNNANVQNFSFLRILDNQAQTEVINRNGGYEYVIAPFWKRAIAELIDMIMLLLIKVVITFTLMNLFDWDWDFESNNEALNQAIDKVDITSFVNVSMDILVFSSNFLMLEIIIKFVVCMYEALWTAYFDGSTPGKAAMNLRIVHCEALLMLPQPRAQLQPPPQLGFQAQRTQLKALIYPAQTPGLIRSIFRAAAKNLIMTILFPICLAMIFFKHNRTSYDIFTKTVVVENNPNAILVPRVNQ